MKRCRNNFAVVLPDEIIMLIFRSNKEIYSLSRTVSKIIRNLSLPSILRYEILLPINKEEVNYFSSHTLISKYYLQLEGLNMTTIILETRWGRSSNLVWGILICMIMKN